ncbi:hypothetical protein [Nocardia sp. MW-W600-9]
MHEFWNEAEDTVMDQVIRPPLQHWEMFEFWSDLDNTGRTTASRLPRNPLAAWPGWPGAPATPGGCSPPRAHPMPADQG